METPPPLVRPGVPRVLRYGVIGALVLLAAILVFFLAPGAGPRRTGTLHLIKVPELGPVWMESDFRPPHRSIFFHALRSDMELVPGDSGTPGVWMFEQRHSTNPGAGRLLWDGKVVHFSPGSGDTRPVDIPLPAVPVADLMTVELRRGLRAFDHGTGGHWTSIRPRWPDPTALDQRVEAETVRIEQEYQSGFFKEVHDAFSLTDLLQASITSGWTCDLRQVVHHRSARAVSVLNYIDAYTGGAHGSHGSVPVNVILGPRGIELLTFSALFQNGFAWQPEVRRLVLDDLRRQGATSAMPQDPDSKSEPLLKLMPEELVALKFTASATGIQIQFDAYEAGSYAEGRYVVELPWNSLRAWVRPEVLEAFTSTPALPAAT